MKKKDSSLNHKSLLKDEKVAENFQGKLSDLIKDFNQIRGFNPQPVSLGARNKKVGTGNSDHLRSQFSEIMDSYEEVKTSNKFILQQYSSILNPPNTNFSKLNNVKNSRHEYETEFKKEVLRIFAWKYSKTEHAKIIIC